MSSNEMLKIFAENLKLVRKTLGLSVEKMAKELGIPASTLWGYEGKKRMPSAELPTQLNIVFAVNANWFLTGKGEMFLKSGAEEFKDVKSEILAEVEEMLKNRGL